MAVDIYAELILLGERVTALELQAKPFPVKVAAVSYYFPGAKWDQLLAVSPPVALSIINPASGPGLAFNTAYGTQVTKAKAAGVLVYGYVHTKYSARPLAEVKADVDKYVAWYAVNGIFVDTTANTADKVAYYADLSAYLRSKGLKIVLNPGTKTVEQYVGLADHIMVAETDAVTYLSRNAPDWEARYPRDKFWHCVHTCPAADMPALVALAKSRHCGLLWVTDDAMANPYDTNPSYLAQLVAEVALR